MMYNYFGRGRRIKVIQPSVVPLRVKEVSIPKEKVEWHIFNISHNAPDIQRLHKHLFKSKVNFQMDYDCVKMCMVLIIETEYTSIETTLDRLFSKRYYTYEGILHENKR